MKKFIYDLAGIFQILAESGKDIIILPIITIVLSTMLFGLGLWAIKCDFCLNASYALVTLCALIFCFSIVFIIRWMLNSTKIKGDQNGA